jgi:hypothetical protein
MINVEINTMPIKIDLGRVIFRNISIIDINVDIKNAPIEITMGNNSYYTNVEQNGIDVSLG